MAIPVIFDTYGEDGDFAYMNGAVGANVTINGGGSNTFRAGYARESVAFSHPAFGVRLWPTGPLAAGWFGCRVSFDRGTGTLDNNNIVWALCDANSVPYLALVSFNSNLTGNAQSIDYKVCTLDAAGNKTVIGTLPSGFSSGPLSPDNFSVQWDIPNRVISFFINSSPILSVEGIALVPDGVTEFGGTRHGAFGDYDDGGRRISWSECLISDGDTRNMNARTNACTAAGTQTDWTGDVGNVDQPIVNDANFDTTTTNGAVQRYVAGQISVGNETILAKVTNLRATKGVGALTQVALAQTLGGGPHVSAPIAFPSAFGPTQFIEPINPATGVAWTFADLNAARETGYKAIA